MPVVQVVVISALTICFGFASIEMTPLMEVLFM